MTLPSTFAERLKELRVERGLSIEKLSKHLDGISHTAIGYWELNKREPKLEAVIKLALFFGVSVGYLAGVEN